MEYVDLKEALINKGFIIVSSSDEVFMDRALCALFGEAQKGTFQTPYYVKSVDQLFYYLGEPPCDTRGLFFAIQSLMHGVDLIYFRVSEEGVSESEYLFGMRYLQGDLQGGVLDALYLPGVGSKELIEEGFQVCKNHESLFIMNEADFYDYLTD